LVTDLFWWTTAELFHAIGLYMLAWSVLVPLEIVWGRESHSLKSRLQAVACWLIFLPYAALLAVLVPVARAGLGLHAVFRYETVGLGGAILAAIASAIAADFFYYWYHRAMHRWLWPIHAPHHSITELNAVSANIHPLDELVRVLLMAVPLALLLDTNTSVAAFMPLLFVLQGHISHSTVKLSYGPLRRVFVDNRSAASLNRTTAP
jgi:sterol desaturase/sphingolipid hydroxylase (fatty acid hydroxylase superfamily)